ncbi:MAG: transporter related [Gemmatimonadetes bacterium]|nr:transporter related [Gemmatimonadota bacterium]
MTAPLLEIHGLSRRYGQLRALSDVSCTVRDGEILGLIGPNGSGKSTLFQCVAGVLPADAGTVLHQGSSLAPEHRKDVLFYLPDGARPWPDERVSWTLRFMEGVFGDPTGRRDRAIAALALEPLLDARLDTLSKGQLRRVLLALALVTPQPILLLDEPFDGLDLRQVRDVMDVLRAEARAGRTLFLSIHQLGDAARVCDRLVLLSGGKVVGEGTLDELRARAGVQQGALEEVFLALT